MKTYRTRPYKGSPLAIVISQLPVNSLVEDILNKINNLRLDTLSEKDVYLKLSAEERKYINKWSK